MKTKRLVPLIKALLVVTGALCTQAAEVPKLINYQGELYTADTEQPINGSLTLKFGLYNASVGGLAVWGEKVIPSVSVVAGRFNVVLGDHDNENPPRSIADAFSANDTVYLQVTVGDGSPLPRQQVLSAPFALRSATAAKADNSSLLLGHNWSAIVQGDPATGTISGGRIASGSLTGNHIADGSLTQNDVGTNLYRLSGFGGSPTNALYVNALGQVGIGSTTPAHALDVIGGGRFSSNVLVGVRLGVGTTAPGQTLDVSGNANVTGIATVGSRLGVGIPVPQAALHVNGDARMAAGNFNVDLSGHVGIGLPATSYSLDVLGNTFLRGGLRITNGPLWTTTDQWRAALQLGSGTAIQWLKTGPSASPLSRGIGMNSQGNIYFGSSTSDTAGGTINYQMAIGDDGVKVWGVLFGDAPDSTVRMYDNHSTAWITMKDVDETAAGITLHRIRIESHNSDGVLRAAKTFVINHPVDNSKYLVHATIEGPESAVYYRGEAELVNGRASVILPHYFESLTFKKGRTVHLTNVDGFDKLAVRRVSGELVKDGQFEVYSDNSNSIQSFTWEVKAVRTDVAPLKVEVSKSEAVLRGDGPYTYLETTKARPITRNEGSESALVGVKR